MNRLTDWLTDWLIDWWLIDRSIDWLIDDWLICWLINGLIDQSMDWLIIQLAGWVMELWTVDGEMVPSYGTQPTLHRIDRRWRHSRPWANCKIKSKAKNLRVRIQSKLSCSRNLIEARSKFENFALALSQFWIKSTADFS